MNALNLLIPLEIKAKYLFIGNFLYSFAGKSRSASVCIAYLMKIKNWDFDQALSYLKERRGIVEPNIGFTQQLRKLNKPIQ
jgi:atypical dual specificity phosphatase